MEHRYLKEVTFFSETNIEINNKIERAIRGEDIDNRDSLISRFSKDQLISFRNSLLDRANKILTGSDEYVRKEQGDFSKFLDAVNKEPHTDNQVLIDTSADIYTVKAAMSMLMLKYVMEIDERIKQL